MNDSHTDNTTLISVSAGRLSKALVEAEDDPDGDHDYLGYAHNIGDLAEVAGVDVDFARAFLADLITSGVARQNQMHTSDQFLFDDTKFRAWRRRRGL